MEWVRDWYGFFCLYIDMTINPEWEGERTSVRMRETNALHLQLRWYLRKAVIYLRIIGQYKLPAAKHMQCIFREKIYLQKESSTMQRLGFAHVLWGDPLPIYCIWRAHISTDSCLEATDHYQHLMYRVSRWNIQNRTFWKCQQCLTVGHSCFPLWITKPIHIHGCIDLILKPLLSSLMQISMHVI